MLGVAFSLEAFGDPNAEVLAHSHIGINRGTSARAGASLSLAYRTVAALRAERDATDFDIRGVIRRIRQTEAS